MTTYVRAFLLPLLTAVIAAAVVQPHAPVTVLRFGQVWDGDRLLKDASVVITGKEISAVGVKVDIPAGAREIDLRAYTGLPGLIDLHTHISYVWDGAAGTTPLRQGPRRSPEEVAKAAAVNARRTLETGVTTIRDLGGQGADLLMRDQVASGELTGPRRRRLGRAWDRAG